MSLRLFSMMLPAVLLTACASNAPIRPVTTLSTVDLPRFMGDWYVIASIPTFLEKGAHNAVESYRLDTDGTIATTFRFNADSFYGPMKQFNPRGFVLDASNARWGMRFVWPFKADYRISWLSEDYRLTVIGREARDYVWIMARTPHIADADYQRVVEFVASEGYAMSKLQRVPQLALNPFVAR
jgi:apolipoprotein D and lipocalin family protein